MPSYLLANCHYISLLNKGRKNLSKPAIIYELNHLVVAVACKFAGVVESPMSLILRSEPYGSPSGSLVESNGDRGSWIYNAVNGRIGGEIELKDVNSSYATYDVNIPLTLVGEFQVPGESTPTRFRIDANIQNNNVSADKYFNYKAFYTLFAGHMRVYRSSGVEDKQISEIVGITLESPGKIGLTIRGISTSVGEISYIYVEFPTNNTVGIPNGVY